MFPTLTMVYADVCGEVIIYLKFTETVTVTFFLCFVSQHIPVYVLKLASDVIILPTTSTCENGLRWVCIFIPDWRSQQTHAEGSENILHIRKSYCTKWMIWGWPYFRKHILPNIHLFTTTTSSYITRGFCPMKL